jgi:DNA-directed RNA polymerase II subunit RPB1
MFESTQHKVASKIVGIQFSILSPEEIRKGSVCEITNRDTYINNKPVIGGFFDPRMGVLEPGLFCLTDGLDYMQTPGYFAHIELAKPVFYVQYLPTILKIMRCVCFKCSKLLISKEKYKEALKMRPEERWKYVHLLANKVKRCGEDTEDGCGCLQPIKIKKEGLASLFAYWKDVEKPIKLFSEIVLKIFKRISDEDVYFMGFSPTFSRPNWMICEVLAIAPPAVRPSVKHDAQQRSEDDLTHIYISIFKANKTLQEKIQNNAPANVIDDWATVLQYYIATLVDNDIPGVAQVAQRSGRPFKSIKDRLNGKEGRMRWNLMAKRVDFSARSVITADPNISIRELGVPMKIAKNITKPVLVNAVNKKFLTMLIKNGPDVYPGAKILEKKNGLSITLKYIDRNSVDLEEGDKVHRHMMNGDIVLFNRQPTLHRMSMMGHIARIMPKGDTFRLNVSVTKPYNADFDGDEMNLHMPQDVEAESELRLLAAVPYQIISPASNKPIIGIFQDSMLGSFLLTRDNVKFTPREAMNLLMMFNRINEQELNFHKDMLSSFEILSQILPPLTLNYKTKLFKEGEDAKKSNHVLEIRNGVYIRGQIDKGVFEGHGKGLLQRICNDYGNMACSQFIDDLQNIVTEYMKMTAFSVGISDLILDKKTNQEIVQRITDKKSQVKTIIDQTQLGIFQNETGKTNAEEFETQVNNLLNQASSEVGKIALENLSKDNRFVVMVNAGSKGSELNIAQVTACLGQQNVDGKRIPYGFEQRTLPHYSKYDDSPVARGFVEDCYINGLTPQGLFFHAMGGRVGLIDTAVKTSSTGYIQRRLIKANEDLMVNYDMTLRTNKNKIVQFKYGDDNIDTVKVENQSLPLVSMSIQDIYSHVNLPDEETKETKKSLVLLFEKNTLKRQKKEINETKLKCAKLTDYLIEKRDLIIQKIFKNKSDNIVSCPVAFANCIANVQGQSGINVNSLVDITMLEAFTMIESNMENLDKLVYAAPTELFKTLYYYYLCPKDLLIIKRFNRAALTTLLNNISLNYKKAIVAPGEMVGLIAGQSIGEISTQMTLNTFHLAGVSTKSNVTRGVPRLEEILSLSPKPKNQSLTIHLKPEDERDKDKAHSFMYRIEYTKLQEIVRSVEICFDPDDLNSLMEEDKDAISQYKAFETMIDECANTQYFEENNEKPKWVLRLVMNPEVMLEKNITMSDVNFALKNIYDEDISCIYSDYNSDKLLFRIRMNKIKAQKTTGKKVNSLDQSDKIYILKNFQDQMMQNIILRGIKDISKITLRKIKDYVVENAGIYTRQESWVLDSVGTNMLEVMGLDYIDNTRVFSNSIMEVYDVLGIEASRQAIYNEMAEVIEFDGTYVNYHHFSVLCDRMSFTSKLIAVSRHGINNDNVGPIMKASFEETPEMFLKAARHGELDNMKGISANVMCGQEGFFGTSSFQVFLNMDKMKELQEVQYKQDNVEDEIDKMFEIENPNDVCSIQNLTMQNNVVSIKSENLGSVSDNYNPGF